MRCLALPTRPVRRFNASMLRVVACPLQFPTRILPLTFVSGQPVILCLVGLRRRSLDARRAVLALLETHALLSSAAVAINASSKTRRARLLMVALRPPAIPLQVVCLLPRIATMGILAPSTLVMPESALISSSNATLPATAARLLAIRRRVIAKSVPSIAMTTSLARWIHATRRAATMSLKTVSVVSEIFAPVSLAVTVAARPRM